MMPKTQYARDPNDNRLFELLLGAELVGVSALSLSAVGSTGWQAGLKSFLLVFFGSAKVIEGITHT